MKDTKGHPLFTLRYWLLVVASLILEACSAGVAVQALWLGLASADSSFSEPPQLPGEDKAERGKPVLVEPRREAHFTGGRGDEANGGAPAHWHDGEKSGRIPSSRRPQAVRTYLVQQPMLSSSATTILQRADGSVLMVDPVRGRRDGKISVPDAMSTATMPGQDNVYVVESRVEDGTLFLRTAKWCTLHHNGGWGDEHTFDHEPPLLRTCNLVPFEIVVQELGDDSLHSHLISGDTWEVNVLYLGKPAPGAKVRVTTERGWSREVTTNADGHATVRIIRDMSPVSWALFDPKQPGEVRIEAHYAVDEADALNDQEYRRVEMLSTFHGRYIPAQREYTALDYGLLIVTFSMAFSGLGVYIYRGRRRSPRPQIASAKCTLRQWLNNGGVSWFWR